MNFPIVNKLASNGSFTQFAQFEDGKLFAYLINNLMTNNKVNE